MNSSAEKRENESRREHDFIRLNSIGSIILDACICVHRALGAGLLESAYAKALIKELNMRELNVDHNVPFELSYKGEMLGKAYVADLVVENQIIIELKSVEALLPIHKFQLITYLKVADKRLGYLVNFNVPLLKDGFHRIINNFSA